jgi:hypothetical protein
MTRSEGASCRGLKCAYDPDYERELVEVTRPRGRCTDVQPPASRRKVTAMSVKSRTASVGATAPAVELVDQHGQVWQLADAVASGPFVLVFLRGFS